MKPLQPPCSAGCPVNTDVRGYVAAIARAEYTKAFHIVSDRNPFPSVCAWICAHPCEDSCRRGRVDGPLSIRALKRFAVENGRSGSEALSQRQSVDNISSGKKVAVVGAGPAGLAAAYELANRSHEVNVFERCPRPGGHLYNSLPTFRLPRENLFYDVSHIQAAGVNICSGIELGKDLSIDELRRDYDAVIIAVGLQVGRRLDLPGFNHPRVLTALSFLQNANRGQPAKVGNRVVVIGGGDVAMDTARTAVRLGAREVLLTCLEFRNIMPANTEEIADALAEGVEILPGLGPQRVLLEDDKIVGLEVKEVHSIFDAAGKFSPVFREDGIKVIPADMVILAIGQRADLSFLDGSEIVRGADGRLILDHKSMATTAAGVFACGEVATGPGAAVAAIASGKKVARQVHRFLAGIDDEVTEQVMDLVGELPSKVIGRLPALPRQQTPALPPAERRGSFVSYEMCYSTLTAQREADRCLRCGMGAVVIPERCAACLTCTRVCPYGVPVVAGRAYIPVEACQGCGICAAACPAGAIVMRGAFCAEDDNYQLVSKPLISQTSLIKIFICQRAFFQGVSPEAISQLDGLSRAHLETVSCSGSLSVGRILEAFAAGAAGVAVISCSPHSCRHAGGSARADKLIRHLGKLLEDIGIDTSRLQLHRLGEGGDPLAWLARFRASLDC